MGLKFEKTDDLDKLFESFAVDPDKKVQKDEDIQKFLKPKNEQTDKKKGLGFLGLVLFYCCFNCCPCFFFSFFCLR